MLVRLQRRHGRRSMRNSSNAYRGQPRTVHVVAIDAVYVRVRKTASRALSLLGQQVIFAPTCPHPQAALDEWTAPSRSLSFHSWAPLAHQPSPIPRPSSTKPTPPDLAQKETSCAVRTICLTDTFYVARGERCSDASWVAHGLLRVCDLYHLELPGPPPRPDPLGTVCLPLPTGYGRVLPGGNWFRLVCWTTIHNRTFEVLTRTTWKRR